jgi:UDPglucose 6-dehydrogenase
METISVIGLGKLGLCMAAAFADAGYTVIGVDVNETVVKAANAGRSPHIEPGLGEMLARTRGRLRATLHTAEAVAASDTTFIVVATPTLPDGAYSNVQLEAGLRAIGAALRAKPAGEYHIVAVSCTVMPGTLDSLVRPLLEEAIGRPLGDGWGLAYNPEFIAMGDVLRLFTRPDFVLIGESEPRVGDRLADIYWNVCPNNPPLARMNLVSAELAKISLNCFVTTKITFANLLAEICEATPGADVDAVTGALGLDARIGPKVLRGGLGFGGPCFPRDNRAFATFAEARGVNADLPRTVHALNQRVEARVAQQVAEAVTPGATVAVLGLAYKPNTPLIDESPGLAIVRELLARGCAVRVYDEFALSNVRACLDGQVTYAGNALACLQGAQAAIITTLTDEFRALTAADFQRALAPGGLVFDCWRLYRGQDFGGLRYAAVGLAAPAEVLA